MLPHRVGIWIPTKPGCANARRHGRIKVDRVPCSLGVLVDISASGARIRSSNRLPDQGAVIGLTIEAPNGPFEVKARVAWSRRGSWLQSMRHEAGVEFLEVSAEARAGLADLVRDSMQREVLKWSPLAG